MFSQLGDIVFEGFFGFDSFNSDAGEAVFAEHQLIGGKPRLVKTGDTLRELAIVAKFHAKFCKPAEQIAVLEAYRSAGEILPLLWGNGKYEGDFVIVNVPYSVDEAFSDGALIQATVTINLKEYPSVDKLAQQKLAAKKGAFAVGASTPVLQQRPQDLPQLATVGVSVSEAKQQTVRIDSLVSDYENNPSKRAVTAVRIKEACDKAAKSLNDVNSKIDEVQNNTTFASIKNSAAILKNTVLLVKGAFPVNNVADLKNINTQLQASGRVFSKASTGLMQQVIIRR